MTAPRDSSVSAAFRRYAGMNRTAAQSLIYRLLRFIGGDMAFADDVLGDLAEERARRARELGLAAARRWYVIEAVRSAPHVAWNAVRRGGLRGSAHVAVVVAAMALEVTMMVIALRSEHDVPARLVMDGPYMGNGRDGIVVNTIHPVRLAMRVVDAEGRALTSTGVRYRWTAGAPVSISGDGIVTCAHARDAVLRASVGAVARTVTVGPCARFARRCGSSALPARRLRISRS